MYSLGFLTLCSLLFALVLTPLVRTLSQRLGLVDLPGEHRKIHLAPIPRTGGVAIGVSYLLALFLLANLPMKAWSVVLEDHNLAIRLIPACILVTLLGLWDDVRGLSAPKKLFGQVLVAIVAWSFGVQVLKVGGFHLVPLLSLPVTVLWLVGCMNAFNLIDGMDGLASGIGFFATITVLIGGLLQGNMSLALATVPLAGALLGFLRYNFNPASIFLGDSGSLLIGLLLGSFGVLWSQKTTTLLGMTAPLIALSLPLLDTVLAIARRFIRGQPIFGADRGHVHHRLLARGLTTRQAVLALYAVCGLFAALSLLQSVFDHKFGGLIIVLFCAGVWIGVQHLGYTEFAAARRVLLGGAFRGLIHAQLCLQAFEESLRKANSLDDFNDLLRKGAPEFGFTDVELIRDAALWGQNGGGSNFLQALDAGVAGDSESPNWTLLLPVGTGVIVRFVRPYEAVNLPAVVAPFVDTVRNVLRLKLAEAGSSYLGPTPCSHALVRSSSPSKGRLSPASSNASSSPS
jgi:UDP-GlcNAc:undecaprenyl-phosphate/decaprenyl-phosphate GlcNAc-1-phosphate transferase